MYKNAALDFFLFFALPAFAYSVAEDVGLIGDETFRALLIALATAGVAYIAAFALLGRYTALDLRQRFEVIGPAFMFASAYWLVLIASRIADGYGDGNTLVLLFGIVVAGGITWRRIAATHAARSSQ